MGDSGRAADSLEGSLPQQQQRGGGGGGGSRSTTRREAGAARRAEAGRGRRACAAARLPIVAHLDANHQIVGTREEPDDDPMDMRL